MKIFRKSLLVASAVLCSAVMAPTAQASVTFNANLASPGVYFGSGNPNGTFTVNTVNGAEMGLRGKVYQSPTQTTPIGNVYNFNLGDVVSFDWSFNPGADGSPLSLAGLTSLLTITNVATGGSFSYNPFLVPDNATSLLAPGGSQNSWRLSFGFLNGPGGIGFNSGVNSTYNISWTLSGDAIGTMSNNIVLNQGSGAPAAVPEPATWAMLIVGFGIAGMGLRRRRLQQIAVPA